MTKRKQSQPRIKERRAPPKVTRGNRGKRLDLTGVRFGSLVAIEYFGAGKRCSFWMCRCDCGSVGQYRLGNLRSGQTRRCARCKGTHRKTRTPEYGLWQIIKRAYGVSREWSTFVGFSKDIPAKRPGMCMRPKDPSKPIGPGNFKWVTRTAASVAAAIETHGVAFNSVTLTIAGWARVVGISREGMRKRLLKLPIEEALNGNGSSRMRSPGRKTKSSR